MTLTFLPFLLMVMAVEKSEEEMSAWNAFIDSFCSGFSADARAPSLSLSLLASFVATLATRALASACL